MKAIFGTKFDDRILLKSLAKQNSLMIKSGSDLYCGFLDRITGVEDIQEDYTPITDIYKKLKIPIFAPISKRHLYSGYNSGVVVGAGSGEDCCDLIGSSEWKLYDLTDERMTNIAIGYGDSTIKFNMVSSRDGDTINNVDEKHITGVKTVEIKRLDSIDIDNCGIISVDAEGSAIDVLEGARDTIARHSPDLLISIYHSKEEYLFAIPMIYDMGYEINAVTTSNFTPSQPHLELTLICKKEYK